MKRLFSIIFILLLASVSWAQEPIQLARMNVAIAGAGGGAACTYPPRDSYSTGTAAWTYVGTYWSTSFTTGSGYAVVKIGVTIKQTGTAPSRTIYAYIFADNAGEPAVGAPLATSTNSYASTAIGANFSEVVFTFDAYTLANATKYHIAITGARTDNSNCLNWQQNEGVAGQGTYYSSNPATSWSSYDTSSQNWFTTYSCN